MAISGHRTNLGGRAGGKTGGAERSSPGQRYLCLNYGECQQANRKASFELAGQGSRNCPVCGSSRIRAEAPQRTASPGGPAWLMALVAAVLVALMIGGGVWRLISRPDSTAGTGDGNGARRAVAESPPVAAKPDTAGLVAMLSSLDRELSGLDRSRSDLLTRKRDLEREVERCQNQLLQISTDHPVLSASILAAANGAGKALADEPVSDEEAAAGLLGGLVLLFNQGETTELVREAKNIAIDLDSATKALSEVRAEIAPVEKRIGDLTNQIATIRSQLSR